MDAAAGQTSSFEDRRSVPMCDVFVTMDGPGGGSLRSATEPIDDTSTGRTLYYLPTSKAMP
jgi:hypothetical protein